MSVSDDRPPMTASSASTSTSTIITNSSVNTVGKEVRIVNHDSVAIEEKHEEEYINEAPSGEDATNVVNNLFLEGDNLSDDGESLELLGISVDHFQNVLYPQFLQAGHSHHSKMYIVENLRNASHGLSSVIRDKGKDAFCPLDGQRGASYVHALLYETESSDSQKYFADGAKPDVVGQASIMISYAWDYAVGDILDTLVTYCELNNLDKKSTFFWMDCLCVNLHRVVELSRYDHPQDEKKSNFDDDLKEGSKEEILSIFASSQELQNIVQYRIQKIGHVLAIMSPFHQPTYLSRLWCMFELGMANTTTQSTEKLPCKITIAIPPRQKEAFMAAIETDTINTINQLYELVNVEISMASTTVEEDAMYILELIQHGQPQRPRSRSNIDRYHGFHKMMKQLIRDWVTNLLTSGVEEKTQLYMEEHNDGNIDFNVEDMKTKSTTFAEEELAQFYNQAAYAFRKNNENELALDLYKKALRIKEALLELQVIAKHDFSETLATAHGRDKGKQKSSSVAIIYNNISMVLQSLGQLDEALDMQQKCLEIREATLSPNNISTASSYHAIAQILHEKGEWADALNMNKKCLETFESVLGTSHPSTATIYDSIASQLQSMGQLDEAMVMYRKALAIKDAELGNHPNTAKSYMSIASLLEDKGEIEDALRMYKKAVKIQEIAIGKKHPSTAATYNNIARILHGLGQKQEALTTWNKALVVLKENIGPDHTQVLVQALVDKLGSR